MSTIDSGMGMGMSAQTQQPLCLLRHLACINVSGGRTSTDKYSTRLRLYGKNNSMLTPKNELTFSTNLFKMCFLTYSTALNFLPERVHSHLSFNIKHVLIWSCSDNKKQKVHCRYTITSTIPTRPATADKATT